MFLSDISRASDSRLDRRPSANPGFSIDAELSAIQLIHAQAASIRPVQMIKVRVIFAVTCAGRVSLQADTSPQFRYKTYHCLILAQWQNAK
jgi:hypothetical protein